MFGFEPILCLSDSKDYTIRKHQKGLIGPTGVKTLPFPKLRLRAVKTRNIPKSDPM